MEYWRFFQSCVLQLRKADYNAHESQHANQRLPRAPDSAFMRNDKAAWRMLIMDKGYMSEIELAAYWGISPKTLQRWRCNGRGPDYVKFGKCVRYSLSAAATFEVNHLAKRRVARTQVAQDAEPLPKPVEAKLTPEQEAVLGRMREFLGSTRSESVRS